MTDSGIYHPSSVAIAISNDGQTFSFLGNAALPSPDTVDFSVGWSELDAATHARYVRYTFTHQQWFFVSELEILGVPSAPPGPPPPPPSGVTVSVGPTAIPPLLTGQTQQFQATVTGSTNTAVSWSTLPSGATYGTIDTTGLYTAPASLPSSAPLTLAVIAASVASPSATATSVPFTVSASSGSQQMVGPVNPNSGSQNPQLFSFTATPITGALSWVQMLFNSTLSPTNACLVYYDPGSNSILLSQDGSTANDNLWTQPAALQTAVQLSNSQCSIDVGNSFTQPAGTGVSINLSITFKAPWSGTQQYIFMAAQDAGNDEVQWPIVGTWIIP